VGGEQRDVLERQAAHGRLLDRWRAALASRRLYEDGAVDPATYWEQARRVVVVLREVNDPGDSFLKLLADGATVGVRTKTGRRTPAGQALWNNVAGWAYGLLTDFPEFSVVPAMTPELRGACLRQIAVVNLNKAGGGARHVPKDLAAEARLRRDLLSEQLRLLDPHVVVCGGTAALLHDVVGLGAPETVCGTRVFLAANSRRVAIDTWHPGAYLEKAAAHYARVMDPARAILSHRR